MGYRSIDITVAYKNEEGIGKTLKSVLVNREELFIITKLWNDDHKRPREALLNNPKKLQPDYIDPYLAHRPVLAIDHYVEVWKGMIELQRERLIKNVGVCNFQIHHLQRLIDETGVMPVISQIEPYPLMQQRQLHAWNATHKIQTESWSPLAQGEKGAFDQKVIRDLADKYDKTLAQTVIRWYLNSGLVVVPKSIIPSRIAENLDVWDSRLNKDEPGEIAKLDQGKRLGPDPDQFGGQHASSPGDGNVPLPDFSEIIYSPRIPSVVTLPCSEMPNIRISLCRAGSS